MRRVFGFLGLWALASTAAHAQNVPVYASGSLTPGHGLALQQTGTPGASVVRDAGSALAGNYTEIGITNDGLPLCVKDKAGQHLLCLGANALGGGLISYNPLGAGAPLDLHINVNGTSYPFPGTGNGNVLGPVSSTVDHVALWNNSLGTLLKDATALNLTGLTVAPATGLSQAIATASNMSGTVTIDTWYNQLQIASDNIVGAGQNLFGGGVYEVCCGPLAQGMHFALAGRIDANTGWSASDPAAVFVGVLGNGRANISAPSIGAGIWGGNMNAQLSPGATGWNSIYGNENDVQVFAGASAPQVKGGEVIVLGAFDTLHGTVVDAGIHFTAGGTSPGWNDLILIDSLIGVQPIATTGTVIGMRGPATFNAGINFGNATITGPAYNGPGGNAIIDGATGYIFSNSMVWSGSDQPNIFPPSRPDGWALTANFSNGGAEVDFWNIVENGGGFRLYQKTGAATAKEIAEFDGAAPALGNTNLAILANNNGGQGLYNITLGAVDSGGAGFRVMRVPN